MVSKKRSLTIWLIWLMIWPMTMFWLYNHDLFGLSFQLTDLSAFIILAIMIACFPIKINKTPIFLINSISLAAFLIFGLFGEIIMSQLAILVVIMRLKINKTEHYRIPLNLLLFLIVSTGSAAVYYGIAPLATNQVTILDQSLLQLIAYVLTSFLINQVTLYLVRRYFYQIKAPFINDGFYFSLLSTTYTLPTGILIVYLRNIFGPAGVLMVSVQIVAISISIKLYYKSKKTNETLHNVNEIIQNLTGHLSKQAVVNAYLNSLPERIPIDTMALYDIVEQDKIQLIHFYKQGEVVQQTNEPIEMSNCPLMTKVLKNKELLSFSKAKEWQAFAPPELKGEGESLVAMPIRRNQQITAFLLIADHKRYAFEESLTSTLDMLNSYFGIALDNAKYYEQMKIASQTDHLTRLPNLRQFENTLKSYQENPASFRINSSLLILDIDYFKRINDQYGHGAGDDVLVQIARLLQNFFKEDGQIFRYGGEEFIVFLPTYSHESSVKVAESFRQLIEVHEFVTRNYMDTDQPAVSIKITISLGVASYPKETDDLNNLVRFADRAMYLDAKRSGRNKVGIYQK